MPNKSWKKYAFEFLSIFIAVISAFALNNWNSDRNDRLSEEKILIEIKNSLIKDVADFQANVYGNQQSLMAIKAFRDWLDGQPMTKDSVAYYYTALFRDYPPVINKSAYESYKANNLKIISNDSLRLHIISLYDYYYNIIEILAYRAEEMGTYTNYYEPINAILAPYLIFDTQKIKPKDIQKRNALTSEEKNQVLNAFWRIQSNRRLKLNRYQMILDQIEKVNQQIEAELNQ